MKITPYLLLLVSLLILSRIAYAEDGCPPGMIPEGGPGVRSCRPIPGYNQDQSSASGPTIRWMSKWGAIATDTKTGGFGVSVNKNSRTEAEYAAIADCKARGGKNCQIETWYGNRCAATVMGDNTHSANNADTEADSIQLGMKVCNEAGDKNCHVYYSGCSLPQRIQ